MATFVLVHGTTAGGWVWRKIAPTLAAGGHTVYTPTLTGLGEREHLLTPDVGLETHILDVVNVLRFEELQGVILAGHSYGGLVITGVADRMAERMAELVYLDGIVPEDGEAGIDLLDEAGAQEMRRRVQEEGEGWKLPVRRGLNDVSTLNTPHPWKSYTEALRLQNPARNRLPHTYVRFTRDKQPGAFYERVMQISWQRAQARGWRLMEVDTVHQITPDPAPKAQVLLAIGERYGSA